jgi:hypothetical protein
MKKLPVIISIYLLIINSPITFGQKKYLSDKFYSSGYYSGVGLAFKPDKTFTLKYHGHISSDSAAGTYEIVGDTILLTYIYNNYDSIFASYKARNIVVPIDIQLDAGRVVLRPKTIIKKRSKLYVIDDETGKIKTNEKNGRSFKVYLRRQNQ